MCPRRMIVDNPGRRVNCRSPLWIRRRLPSTGNRPVGNGNPPTWFLLGAVVQLGLVAPRGLPDHGAERLDEGRRVRPPAGDRGVSDGVAVREPDQGVVDAQDGSPTVETHA